jgi:O-antigen/teichoic acid export membrane protein
LRSVFYSKSGLDASIVFTIIARLIQGIGGIFTLLLITKFLDKNEQGYYYTFASILSIQIFFELGLTSIITQYVAHEVAHLKWKDNTHLEGDEYYRSRLASIIKLGIGWMLFISAILFFVFLLAGQFFFHRYNSHLQVRWQAAWLILSISTTIIIVINLLFAILEGLGKIKEVSQLRLLQQFCQLASVFILFYVDLRLLASGLALLFSAIITFIALILSSHLKLIKNIWKEKTPWKINYRKEVFPFQLRIALGSMGGYLIYQLINPVLFATQGAILAGQMGATQAVLNGILLVSLSWFSTKVALFSTLVARQKFVGLKLFYKKNLFVSVLVSVLGICAFIGLAFLLQLFLPDLGCRFLSVFLIAFLGATQIASVIGNAQAYYLRSFKKEPFFIPSIVIGLASGAATIICGRLFGIKEIIISYFIVNGMVGFIWGCIIFRRKAYEWTGTKMNI